MLRWLPYLAAPLALACSPSVGAQPTRVALAPPARPEPCREISMASDVKAAIESAEAGSALCLSAGIWRGSLRVPAGVKVWGPRGAIVRSLGTGTTIALSAGASLSGITVDGSGGRFDTLDAAVHVEGEDTSVEGVKVVNAAFGILVEKAKRARVRGNHVLGPGGALGLRGDGIRLWEVRDSIVEGNLVERSRDLVVWYSSGNALVGNEIREGRYGTHFMYSHQNQVTGNSYLSNEVGVFAMYSKDLTIDENVFAASGGAAGIGLGLKESGNISVRKNRFVRNTQGVFIDSSPLDPSHENLFEENVIELSDVGVGFLSSQRDNTFRRNTFANNRTQVRVEGGGDALALAWVENRWDDYVGYDLDRDGVGDLPYELRDLSSALLARFADLAFLDGTPALTLVSIAGHVAPLLAPKPVLHDPRPRMEAP